MTPQIIGRTLEKRGLSKKGLAEALGISNSGVTALIGGTRRINVDEVPAIRRYLGLDTVPLKGYVGASDEAHFYRVDDDDLGRVPAPDESDDTTVAVEIRGKSLGEALDREYVYYNDVRHPVTDDLVNRLCIVWLSDDRVLIKKIRKGSKPGLFDLEPLHGKRIVDVKIERAARVLRIL